MTELLVKKFRLGCLCYSYMGWGWGGAGFTLSTGLYYTKDSPQEVSPQSVKKWLSYEDFKEPVGGGGGGFQAST